MTTDSSDIRDEDYLVHVKAQVMTRDDSKGGWVPLGGGGMSVIGLCRSVSIVQDEMMIEFLIYGRRIADKSVILRCILKKDLQYTKANPTFHHWKMESGRFGLTFQSSTDARIFEKGIRKVVESLKTGSHEKVMKYFRGEDQDVFMTLNLPLERRDSVSRPESTASTTVSTPSAQSPTSPTLPLPPSAEPSDSKTLILAAELSHTCCSSRASSKIADTATPTNGGMSWVRSGSKPPCYFTFPPLNVKTVGIRNKTSCVSLPDKIITNCNNGLNPSTNGTTGHGLDAANDPYVEFKHKEVEFEYNYPQIDFGSRLRTTDKPIYAVPTVPHLATPIMSRSASHPRSVAEDQPTRRLLSKRVKCVYCHEMFVPEENRRGGCIDGPDPVVVCIEKISCCCCARALIYHCLPADEAETSGSISQPCSCGATEKNNCKRWTALAFLSLIVPCLWCYWPLTGCHVCAVSCGCCGVRHMAAT